MKNFLIKKRQCTLTTALLLFILSQLPLLADHLYKLQLNHIHIITNLCGIFCIYLFKDAFVEARQKNYPSASAVFLLMVVILCLPSIRNLDFTSRNMFFTLSTTPIIYLKMIIREKRRQAKTRKVTPPEQMLRVITTA